MPDGWEELIGKRVVVGLTYEDDEGAVIERTQKHGVIVKADDEGVFVRAEGSAGEFELPPDLSGFEPAEKGEYTLRETGEVVVDPDFVATWTVRGGPE